MNCPGTRLLAPVGWLLMLAVAAYLVATSCDGEPCASGSSNCRCRHRDRREAGARLGDRLGAGRRRALRAVAAERAAVPAFLGAFLVAICSGWRATCLAASASSKG